MYPTGLRICGSHINAMELAGAMVRRGHEVVVYGQGGPLVPLLEPLGIQFARSVSARLGLEGAVVRELATLVADYRFDVVHAFEWRPTVDAVLAAQVACGVPVVSTVYSMSVPDFFPAHVPLVVGTPAIAAQARRRHRARVTVIEPPVDLGPEPGETARARTAGPTSIVIVSRLHPTLKLEGILAAIAAVDRLGAVSPQRELELVIVGDGPAAAVVTDAAAAVSARGRARIVMAGAALDPTPFYRSADIVIGMGHSALRAMGMAKPTIIQGEDGFWELVSTASIPRFLYTGWYGIGDHRDRESSVRGLVAILTTLLDDAQLLGESAAAGYRVVVERFTLDRAAARQARLYEEVMRNRSSRLRAAVEALRSLHGISRTALRALVDQDHDVWDFNHKHAQPLYTG
ncbi:Glycosyltransferase involved in cell wall bisynthesis [Actinokineospora diospyrosa]|uniref:Glycosyltransferase involved in cell wall bisynthesis n=1 Tax=Actinokineospora diospyrosa TaxID=103728 RepID=A0ABT1IJ23_9PSEU|nr:Glycosyltransferase involved in cell wall bisynthesis [Actinokineospora diospyrosa]